MSARSISRIVGTAAGAFLAAGLIPLASSAIARADGDDLSPGVDTDFIDNVHHLGQFTITDAADPSDHEFVAFVLQGPHFTDTLTSGADPSDSLGNLLGTPGATDIGMVGDTVNTFVVPSDPALDSTVTLPFTDPFAELFTLLVHLGF